MITKTKTECETKLCYYESATRTKFFHGMLLTDDHLQREQDYHREARKRFNRHLFGSGIVCGLQVERQETGLCIKVHPGAALDCCGNLIEVCNCITIDLAKECKERYGADCIPKPPDPKDFEITKYLVLRYVEEPTDLEPVLTPDSDCKSASDKPECQASKIREGYCIELWDNCPCPETVTEPAKSLLAVLRESRYMSRQEAAAKQPQPGGRKQQIPPPPADSEKDCIYLPLPCSECGCCESSNAVGLAELKINCADNTVQIVTCTCRRYVISPRMLNWLFSSLQAKIYKPTELDDATYAQLGYLPTAHMLATFATHEENSKKIQECETRIGRLERPKGKVIQTTKPASKASSKKPATPII